MFSSAKSAYFSNNISQLHSLALRAREASNSLLEKRETLATAYQKYMTHDRTNDSNLESLSGKDPILESLVDAERLKDLILFTNLFTGLLLKFTETLSNIFDIGKTQDLKSIAISKDEDLQRLTNNIFKASRYFSEEKSSLFNNLMFTLQSKFDGAIKQLKHLAPASSALQLVTDLKDALSKLYEIDALKSLFNDIAQIWEENFPNKHKNIAITTLKNNLGEGFLKHTKALNAVLMDFINRLRIAELFPYSHFEPETIKQAIEADIKKKASKVNQLYEECGFGSTSSEIETTQEEVNSTGGDIDKLIELFEAKQNV